MLKLYTKKDNQSYTLGVAPTIELLEKRPDFVTQVVINPKGLQNSGVQKIIETCKKLKIPMEHNQKITEKLSATENTYALASFKKYSTSLIPYSDHLVLVNPSDMGNLGTICRTMLAFGFTNLGLIKPAADIFDPKVIRASMGAVFSINFEYFDSFEDYQNKFTHNVYTFMGDGAATVDETKFIKPFTLVFGNEGEGLAQNYKKVGTSVRIPQGKEVDSFNLSVAVGIALYSAQITNS